jgi:methyl-accepting chemotaxis protein
VIIATVSVYALQRVVTDKDRVIATNAQNLAQSAAMEVALGQKVIALRGYLLNPNDRDLRDADAARKRYLAALMALKASIDSDGRALLDQVEAGEEAHQAAANELVERRRSGLEVTAAAKAFDEGMGPAYDRVEQALAALGEYERRLLETRRQEATVTANQATTLVIGFAVAAVVLGVMLALTLGRAITRQIGSAIHHIQSSSAELQSAANQQAAGAREQATAMAEMATTIKELLATSRQIAESAQRVTGIAETTASSATSGDSTVESARTAVDAIRRQVDIVVAHMLDLGKKSQQIGGVLEIINELSEQTNILAINATIEAAGAGEAGRRFSVVADEIRKLADRVGGSTREIRELVEQVRASINATVMATESGSKAVDAGTRQFGAVAEALKRIIEMSSTTNDAAREIELSTRQQATGVEQVNVAVADVAQATRESEASASQTLETASQLVRLSQEMSRLIQAARNPEY